MRTYLRVFAFSFVLFLLFLHPINASDYYHHVITGRFIAQTHSLPYTDTFSFTASGLPWVAYAWGTGLIYYMLESTGGPVAVSIFTAVIGLLTAWAVYFFLRKRGNTMPQSSIITLLVASMISLRYPTRPEILAPFYISVLLLLLEMSPKMKRFIPLLFFVWGITYGSSAIFGLLILVWYTVTHSKEWKSMGVLIILSFVASLLNGYGFRSLFYILLIPNIAPHTGEWLPILTTLNPQLPELVLFYQYQVLAYGIFSLLALIAISTSLKNIYIVGLGLGVIAPFLSVRFLNLAPILAAALLGAAVLKKHLSSTVLLVLFCILGLATGYLRYTTFGIQTGKEFQTKPMEFLRNKHIDGNIFSIQELGALIAWELPKSKIFIDTRDDLYQPTGLFAKLQELDSGKRSLIDLLSEYHADIVIGDLANGSVYKPLFYSPDWSLVYLTDGFFVSVKTPIAREHRLTIFSSIDPLRMPPAKPGNESEAILELQKALILDPKSDENIIRLAETYYALGDFSKAYTTAKTTKHGPTRGLRWRVDTIARGELIGKYALAAGDCDSAKPMLLDAELASFGGLFFSPKTRFPTVIDRYLGRYYAQCEQNTDKAKVYYLRFLQSGGNPLEKRSVERELNALQ